MLLKVLGAAVLITSAGVLLLLLLAPHGYEDEDGFHYGQERK